MSKVRFAVIGTGWIAQEAFIPSVPQTGNSEIVALVTGNRAKAQKLADFHGIPEVVDYKGFDALAKSGRIDAVYVATPNSLHAEYAIRAAKHGLHALVEKPLAISIAESKKMIAAAKAAKTYLVTAYRLHNDPGTLQFMKLAKDGTIGEARHFTAAFSFQANDGNHRLKGKHWGGPLQDLGVYSINAARHVFGDNPIAATAVTSKGYKDKRFKETEEGVAVTLEFPRGRMAQFYSGFGTELTDHFQVLGTKGTLHLKDACRFATTRTLTVQTGSSSVETKIIPDTENFSGMVRYFSDCILKREKPHIGPDEGLFDMEALVAILKSAATGKRQVIKSAAMKKQLHDGMERTFQPVKKRLVL